jgi:hypothetical protein
MHRRRCRTQHLSEHRVECAKLGELGCVRALRTLGLDAVLLLHRRHMLVRVQDRMRKPDMLREQQKRASDPKQSALDGQ